MKGVTKNDNMSWQIYTNVWYILIKHKNNAACKNFNTLGTVHTSKKSYLNQIIDF